MTFDNPGMREEGIALVLGFFLVSVIWNVIQNRGINRYGDRKVLARFSRFTRTWVTTIVLAAALASLAVAAAQPSQASNDNTTSQTLNAVIVLDVTRSMLAEDGPGNVSRLQAGIQAVEQLFREYPDGRFGLVLYTTTRVVYPPSPDHQALKFILDRVVRDYKDIVRGEGTNHVSALDDAVNLIGEVPYTIDTIFLISDGGKSLSPIVVPPPVIPVIEKLRKLGVRIVAVGVGEFIPTTIPTYDPNTGEFIGYHQYQGQVVPTSLEETFLRQVADATSGWYLHLQNQDDLIQITRSEHLDSQPTAQPTTVSLVWLPITISLLLVLLLLLGRAIVRPRIS